MASIYSHKDTNIKKTYFLFAIFLIIVIGVGLVFSRVYGNSVILYIAVGFSVIMNIAGYWWSDKIVLRMARAVPIKREDFKYKELFNIVENLSITAGLPMPRLYIVREQQPNAFATGRDPKHGVVAVTEGLIERLDRSELEGVIAHELSHIGNRDMLLSTAVVVLVGFIAILSDMFMRSLFFRSIFGRRDEQNSGGGALMIVGILFSILAPIVAMIMQLAISRKREFLADASGALLTRYPEGLASALEKIASDPHPMNVASNTTAHLWLDSPFKGKEKKSGFRKLFMTHPPTDERVKALRGIKI